MSLAMHVLDQHHGSGIKSSRHPVRTLYFKRTVDDHRDLPPWGNVALLLAEAFRRSKEAERGALGVKPVRLKDSTTVLVLGQNDVLEVRTTVITSIDSRQSHRRTSVASFHK